MAGKEAPPPYYPPAHQGAQPQHNVIYVQQPTIVAAPKPKTNHGLFGFVERELNAAGRMIDREIGAVANTISSQAQVLNAFATNNVVQLISRSSGGTLQVVQSSSGHLVVDGCGPDAQAFNNVWTVINEGNNMVRLHNNNNYLAIVNGTTTVVFMPPGSHHGIETKLRLSTVGQFVLMESCKESGGYVGILNNGSLKSALATGRENHSHFGVRLVSSPYPQQGAKK